MGEQYRLGVDFRAVQRWFAAAFDMHHDKAVGPLGNGRHGHARLADGGDDLDQGHFAARSGA